jgi:hypothetical protein
MIDLIHPGGDGQPGQGKIRPRPSTSTTTPHAVGGSPTGPELEDDAVRDRIREIMEHLFFQQAGKALGAGAAYGAAIILTAALHYLASLAYGPDESIDGDEVRGFCEAYLEEYAAESVWLGLRCGLFHRGVPQNSARRRRKSPAQARVSRGTALLHPAGVPSPGVVLDELPGNHDPDGSRRMHPGSMTIAVPCFLEDLRSALGRFLARCERDGCLMANCRSTYDQFRPIPVKTGGRDGDDEGGS